MARYTSPLHFTEQRGKNIKKITEKEQDVLRLLTALAELGNVRTTRMQAFVEKEFNAIEEK